MRRLKQTCRGLIQLVLVVLILCNLFTIYTQYGDDSDLLESIPFGVIEVTGGSMEPYLSPGDGIFVYEVPFDQLKPQDTILFAQGGELITHRIQSVGDGYVITRGTANDIDDLPVYEESYRAKVIFSIPYLSVILVFYQSPFYFAMFAVVLFFFIFSRSLAEELYEQVEQMRLREPLEDSENP